MTIMRFGGISDAAIMSGRVIQMRQYCDTLPLMKSVRLDSDLHTRLTEAARMAGVTESEFIRAAIDERSSATLAAGLESRLTGLVGAVRTKGGRATTAHQRYRDLLKRRTARSQTSRP
jgi:predicted transcriptional regulator